MAYFVYKVTNNITGDFYVGVHKTHDPNDRYLGSGRAIREQVAAFGEKHFSKEVLFNFSKRHDAYNKEAEVLAPLLKSPGCLNLHPGGQGGFGYVNLPGGAGERGRQKAHDAKNFQKGLARHLELLATDPEYAARHNDRLKVMREKMVGLGLHLKNLQRAQEMWRNGEIVVSDATRVRLSDSHRGEKNGRFGLRFIHNPMTGETQNVPICEVAEKLKDGWAKGKHPKPKRKQRVSPHLCLCGSGSVTPVCARCRSKAERLQLAEKVIQMFESGVPTLDIADQLPISRRTVYRLLGRTG